LWREFLSAFKKRNERQGPSLKIDSDWQSVKKAKEEIIDQLKLIFYHYQLGGGQVGALREKWKKIPRAFHRDLKNLDNIAYILFDKLRELDFISGLILKKGRLDDQWTSDKLTDMMKSQLEEMLVRDKREVEMIHNSSGIIHSHDARIQKMFGKQIESKIRRVSIKSDLLQELSTGKIKITRKT
jgi:hypothetical protein